MSGGLGLLLRSVPGRRLVREAAGIWVDLPRGVIRPCTEASLLSVSQPVQSPFSVSLGYLTKHPQRYPWVPGIDRRSVISLTVPKTTTMGLAASQPRRSVCPGLAGRQPLQRRWIAMGIESIDWFILSVTRLLVFRWARLPPSPPGGGVDRVNTFPVGLARTASYWTVLPQEFATSLCLQG